MEEEKTEKVAVIPVNDFQILVDYIRRVTVNYDMIEMASKVKEIINNVKVGDVKL